MKKRPALGVLRGSTLTTTFVRLVLFSEASVCANSNDKVVSKVQRNSQRGVGTACQSREGSHSQGCHWRKRLESCIEIERDNDRRERGRGGMEDEEEAGTGARHIEKDRGGGGGRGVTGAKDRQQETRRT